MTLYASFNPNHFAPYFSYTNKHLLQALWTVSVICGVFFNAGFVSPLGGIPVVPSFGGNNLLSSGP